MPLSPEETMAVASVGGAAASSLIDHTPETIWYKVRHWAAGSIVAVFAGPMIADIAKLESDHLRIGAAVVVGAVGKVLLSKLVNVVNNIDLKELISRLIGKPLS
jgi:hypothetical protein